MDKLIPMLPFLIPIILLELALFVPALIHILTHTTYKRWTRPIWILICLIQIVGPILYFMYGKSED